MAVPAYTKSGAKASAPVTLDKSVFGLEVKSHNLLKEAYLAYLANGRQNSAKTKKRGEVRGGGRKPWRQKGTGRARFGSSRNPIWTGGGVAFGPTGQENYTRKLNQKAKHQAIKQALSLAARAEKIKIIESFNFADGKTREARELLSKLQAQGRILLVVDDRSESVLKATRNLKGVKVAQARYLNVYELMNADSIVIVRPALEQINDWLGGA